MVSEESGIMGSINQGLGTQLRACSQYQHRLCGMFLHYYVHGAFIQAKRTTHSRAKVNKAQVEILKTSGSIMETNLEVAVVHSSIVTW